MWKFAPKPGTVLYNKTSWEEDLDGWSGTQSWTTVEGMLVNDGTYYPSDGSVAWLVAPYEPGRQAIDNYAVEAEVQFLADSYLGDNGFGLYARAGDPGSYRGPFDYYHGGYWVGFDGRWCCSHDLAYIFYAGPYSTTALADVTFSPDSDWHTYRVELTGNSVRLRIDDLIEVQAVDNHHLKGGKVGLWSAATQINVRSFKVVAK